MSLVIQTIVGKTSVGQCPLKKYTRIGSDENSNLVLLEDGVPEVVCIVEKTDGDSARVHCKSSNTSRLAGKLLHRGTVVEWNKDETLDICGGTVKLRLVDESDVPHFKTKDSGGAGAASRKTRLDSFSRDPSVGRGASMVSIADFASYEDSDKAKKKQTKLTIQLLIILLCAIACCALILTTNRKKPDWLNPISVAYYILGGEKSDERVAVRTYDDGRQEARVSVDKKELADLLQKSYLLEDSNTLMALDGYNVLADKIQLAYLDEVSKHVRNGKSVSDLTPDELDVFRAETRDLFNSYDEAYRIVKDRIYYLSSFVGE